MWTLLVTWAVVQSGMAYQDMWMIENPVFTSRDACVTYGQLNRQQIINDAMREFETTKLPDKLYCIDEKAREFLIKKGYKVEQL